MFEEELAAKAQIPNPNLTLILFSEDVGNWYFALYVFLGGCGFCSNYLLRKLFAALEDEVLDGVGGTAVVVGGGS